MDTIPPDALDVICQRLDEGERRFVALESGQQMLANQLEKNMAMTSENTEITKQIKALLEAMRLGFKVAGWVGTFVRWAGGIAGGLIALWALFTHGPRP